MEIARYPPEVLALITSYLDWLEIFRKLFVIGSPILREKLVNRGGIEAIQMHRPFLELPPNFPKLSFPVAGLKSLTLRLVASQTDASKVTWASELPSTLTEIDFCFDHSHEVWLRKRLDSDRNIPNVHMLVHNQDLIVMSMRDHFPNLRTLLLRTDDKSDYDDWSMPKAYYFILNLPDTLTRFASKHVRHFTSDSPLIPLPKSVTRLELAHVHYLTVRALSRLQHNLTPYAPDLTSGWPSLMSKNAVPRLPLEILASLTEIVAPEISLALILSSFCLHAPSLTFIVAAQPNYTLERLDGLMLPAALQKLILRPVHNSNAGDAALASLLHHSSQLHTLQIASLNFYRYYPNTGAEGSNAMPLSLPLSLRHLSLITSSLFILPPHLCSLHIEQQDVKWLFWQDQLPKTLVRLSVSASLRSKQHDETTRRLQLSALPPSLTFLSLLDSTELTELEVCELPQSLTFFESSAKTTTPAALGLFPSSISALSFPSMTITEKHLYQLPRHLNSVHFLQIQLEDVPWPDDMTALDDAALESFLRSYLPPGTKLTPANVVSSPTAIRWTLAEIVRPLPPTVTRIDVHDTVEKLLKITSRSTLDPVVVGARIDKASADPASANLPPEKLLDTFQRPLQIRSLKVTDSSLSERIPALQLSKLSNLTELILPRYSWDKNVLLPASLTHLTLWGIKLPKVLQPLKHLETLNVITVVYLQSVADVVLPDSCIEISIPYAWMLKLLEQKPPAWPSALKRVMCTSHTFTQSHLMNLPQHLELLSCYEVTIDTPRLELHVQDGILDMSETTFTKPSQFLPRGYLSKTQVAASKITISWPMHCVISTPLAVTTLLCPIGFPNCDVDLFVRQLPQTLTSLDLSTCTPLLVKKSTLPATLVTLKFNAAALCASTMRNIPTQNLRHLFLHKLKSLRPRFASAIPRNLESLYIATPQLSKGSLPRLSRSLQSLILSLSTLDARALSALPPTLTSLHLRLSISRISYADVLHLLPNSITELSGVQEWTRVPCPLLPKTFGFDLPS